MKTYKSSDLTHNRAEVMREAERNGVIIQERRTNGEVVKEFVMQLRTPLTEFTGAMISHYEGGESLIVKGGS